MFLSNHVRSFVIFSLFFSLLNFAEARSIQPERDLLKLDLTGGIEMIDQEGNVSFNSDLVALADVSPVEEKLSGYLGSDEEKIIGKIYKTVDSSLNYFVFFSHNKQENNLKLYTLMIGQNGSILSAVDYDIKIASESLLIGENGVDEDVMLYDIKMRNGKSFFLGSGPL